MAIMWNGQAASAQVQQEAARRLQRTAQWFQDQLIARLSLSNPRPYLNSSRPGEYPRKRTGTKEPLLLKVFGFAENPPAAGA